ncbi:DUF488 domain-containing protein [candidate division WOR-3 bacterium]|nr:DUF488 domain-containing protein [candidate division WOR-3 bacterium]
MSGSANAGRAGPPVVLTVGHSNVAQEAFIALLKQHGIEVLVDVRSQPYSKYVPHFNADALKAAILAAGMKYLYLGKELGGRPDNTRYYDADGRVRYDLVAESPAFIEGVERLLRGAREHRVALMCNEENPAECHRRLLVGRVLAGQDVEVRHIRGDGRVQLERELAEEERARAPSTNQQEFAFVAREDPEWKSTRSVSPARPQKRSSES